MISCHAFRDTLRPGTSDPAVLEHLRKCDACLDWAVSIDPDNFFRAIGGEEHVPPGGVDAFAAGVMAQVRARQKEGSVRRRFPRRSSWFGIRRCHVPPGQATHPLLLDERHDQPHVLLSRPG